MAKVKVVAFVLIVSWGQYRVPRICNEEYIELAGSSVFCYQPIYIVYIAGSAKNSSTLVICIIAFKLVRAMKFVMGQFPRLTLKHLSIHALDTDGLVHQEISSNSAEYAFMPCIASSGDI